jgi:hypothetical protein
METPRTHLVEVSAAPLCSVLACMAIKDGKVALALLLREAERE